MYLPTSNGKSIKVSPSASGRKSGKKMGETRWCLKLRAARSDERSYPQVSSIFFKGQTRCVLGVWHMGVEPKIGVVLPPKSSICWFSIIFTIHFGVPLFLVQHPYPTAITIKNQNPSQVLLLVLSADVRVLRELPEVSTSVKGNFGAQWF